MLAGYNLDQIEIAKVSPGLHQFYNSGSLGVESSETIDDLYTHIYIKNLPPNHHYKPRPICKSSLRLRTKPPYILTLKLSCKFGFVKAFMNLFNDTMKIFMLNYLLSGMLCFSTSVNDMIICKYLFSFNDTMYQSAFWFNWY